MEKSGCGGGVIVAGGWKRCGAMKVWYLPYKMVVGHGSCPENARVHVPWVRVVYDKGVPEDVWGCSIRRPQKENATL